MRISNSLTESEYMQCVEQALYQLETWIERESFQGWDPYDALNSPLLKRMTFRSRFFGIAWVQLLKRSPLNMRPLLRVPKGYNPKGMGLFMSSYLRKYQLTGDPKALDRVRFFAEWLYKNISPGYSGACWGYNFDWPNRGFFAPAGTPTAVNTAFIASAFLDLYELPSSPCLEASDTPLGIARSACDFILRDLNRLEPSPYELCFSCTPLDHRWVHNANILGALLLARVYKYTEEETLARHAIASARFTAARQRSDGTWPYGEGKQDTWVDNFHTGFVLVALKQIAQYLDTKKFDRVLDRGYRFWKQHMFLPEGTPKYYPDRVYPIDIHNVAQAVLTFLEFADLDPEAREWAWRVARWSIEHMQDPKGYFHYQIHRHYRIRIPYMRWSQAWMFLALIHLDSELD